MWLILQQGRPEDYVVASGESHSVQELVEASLGHVGLGCREHVRTDAAFKRGPAELRRLVGNPAKTRTQLGWQAKVGFTNLVQMLVAAVLNRLRAGATSVERR